MNLSPVVWPGDWTIPTGEVAAGAGHADDPARAPCGPQLPGWRLVAPSEQEAVPPGRQGCPVLTGAVTLRATQHCQPRGRVRVAGCRQSPGPPSSPSPVCDWGEVPRVAATTIVSRDSAIREPGRTRPSTLLPSGGDPRLSAPDTTWSSAPRAGRPPVTAWVASPSPPPSGHPSISSQVHPEHPQLGAWGAGHPPTDPGSLPPAPGTPDTRGR